MEEMQARWEVHDTLRRKGFKHVGPGPDQYRGPLRIGHTSVEINLDIPDLSFTVLPRIEFVDRGTVPLPLIAHLEQGTGLCYADGTLMRLDRFAPGASILRVLEEAETTIAKSQAGKAPIEISQEFPRYWSSDYIQVLVSKTDTISEGYLALPVGGSGSEILLLANEHPAPAGYDRRQAVAIIHVAGNFVPVEPYLTPEILGQLEEWHERQSVRHGSFARAIEYLARGDVVFYHADNGWVGCSLDLPADLRQMKTKQGTRPAFIERQLLLRKNKIRLMTYRGMEASLDHVTTRNLPLPVSLKGKRIALIGCGTIGSHLARFLMQSGAGNDAEFILIDNQPLEAGNLGRHLLNFDSLGKSKAAALATELKRFHPDVRITAINNDAVLVWPRVESADLIIDATGVEAVSDMLNAEALAQRKAGRSCNLLHTWLFANGVAAQAFLNVGGDYACYRCLRPDLDRPWISDPRKDVKNSGKVVPASCGDGPYLPFAVDAPVAAAAITLRAALDFVEGRPDPRLRNVRIDSGNALLLNDRSPPPHERCPACQ